MTKTVFDEGESRAFELAGYQKITFRISFSLMLLSLVKFVGWFISVCPEFLLSLFSQALGRLIYHGYRPRRKIMLYSLSCSFPERSEAWRRNIALQSCIRLVETTLLSIASPFFSEARISRMAGISEEAVRLFNAYQASPRPVVLGTAHLAYWEGLTWVPFKLRPKTAPEIVTIFRPLRNPKLDEWVRLTRERFGVKLMSRRSGLHAASHTLQRNGVVTILFDQSAGSHGYLTKFLGRECSTTPLPGMLLEKFGGELALIYCRRHAFWRFTIEMEAIPTETNAHAVTLALNRRLEALLQGDDNLCASWLWLHQRWRILDRPEEKRKLEEKRGGLIG